MDDPNTWDLIKSALVVLGGIAAAFVTARLGRKSQAEANSISEANGLVERYDKLTKGLQAERDAAAEGEKSKDRQISIWRRYAYALRQQLHAVGVVPAEAPNELDL